MKVGRRDELLTKIPVQNTFPQFGCYNSDKTL